MPKPTGYAIHLREKQKVRSIYGILERQFRGYFEKASRMKGVTGDNLLALLERRLDNVVYRLGFAASRSAARQLIGHRHFTVNGRVVNIPSHIMRPGDEVRVRPKSKEMVPIKDSMEKSKGSERANWLELDAGSLTGRVVSIPARESMNLPINEQLIVELYSK
jgi:small subunit ribosomal protein S4